MKYVNEFRDNQIIHKLVEEIHQLVTSHWRIMEICGGQTHSIVKFGLDQLLPEGVELIHGPGCPVCVTPAILIDLALELAAKENVILCSFGDMLRVPGSELKNLQQARSQGARIKIIYSPLEALALAEQNPDKEVVLLAVGFETTTPAHAMAVKQARQRQVQNFSLLHSLVLVPPAMEALLGDSDSQINGFLAAGHVCTITGYTSYEAIAKNYKRPIVITGFEPLDIMLGLRQCLLFLESGQNAAVSNEYKRSVRLEGNQVAQALVAEVFQTTDQEWRGLGILPKSGLDLKESYQQFDARKRFSLFSPTSQNPSSLTDESQECISGEILKGAEKPPQCPHFGQRCTPSSPLGAPMVSSEGACAAYYRYRQAESFENAKLRAEHSQ